MRFTRLHRTGIVRYLTTAQKADLCTRFQVPDAPALDYILLTGNDDARHILRGACRTLGIKDYYPKWVNTPIRSGYVHRRGKRRGT